MRQTFPLSSTRHKPAQALAALKHKLRKYIKRERQKPLPEGVDYWDFDCRIGPEEEAAVPVHVADLIGALDVIAASEATQVYVEVLARPGIRGKRQAGSSGRPQTGSRGPGTSRAR
jgi:hypothetical protein